MFTLLLVILYNHIIVYNKLIQTIFIDFLFLFYLTSYYIKIHKKPQKILLYILLHLIYLGID